jgi:D-alanyl-D-alanine carboxypeptidase
MKKSFALSFIILVVVTFTAQSFSQSFKQAAATQSATDIAEIKGKIQTKLNELRANADFPGVTVGFVLADGRSGSVSIGYSDVENKTPMKTQDRMLAGSIGKTYVAAAMLQLVQDKKVNLDDKIEKWLGRESWFARLPNAKDLTLRMLMTHSSGIPEHVLNKDLITRLKQEPEKVWKPEELLAYIFDVKPLFAAGQGFSYADTNYIIVGMIFERITKKTVYGEVERRILKPLKLERTIPSDKMRLPEVITGYTQANNPFGINGRMIIDGRFVFNPQFEWTGGGFASTAEDLARWAKALYEAKVFGKDELAQMLTGVNANEGRGGGANNKYGLAVQIRPSNWGTSYGHEGWYPGYLSAMEYFPDHKVAIAVQFNTDVVQKLKRGPRVYLFEVAKILLGDKNT